MLATTVKQAEMLFKAGNSTAAEKLCNRVLEEADQRAGKQAGTIRRAARKILEGIENESIRQGYQLCSYTALQINSMPTLSGRFVPGNTDGVITIGGLEQPTRKLAKKKFIPPSIEDAEAHAARPRGSDHRQFHASGNPDCGTKRRTDWRGPL